MNIGMIYNYVFMTICFFAGFFIGRWFQKENSKESKSLDPDMLVAEKKEKKDA